MMRWDIINHLIKQNNYTSYLEIGYYKGWSFDRVICDDKTAVDPNPSKTPEQEQLPLGEGMGFTLVGEDGKVRSGQIYKKTSDAFFSWVGDRKYDIIFIDGLHESQQVDRDIQNALKHLNPGGTIVMHDCNPSTYEMTTTGTVNGEWTGDVYKSFIRVRSTLPFETYVVDTDYGVGIIKPDGEYVPGTTLSTRNFEENGIYERWDYFQERKKWALNLITPEEFLQRETNETTTDNHLPA